ncbi:MAG: hypothetical protein IJ233_12450 [Pyramidobacter sp.]|nr:hypothetical protein [Pyramidobacter sp.]
MKKNRLILSGLAIALLGASAAIAAPHMPPMGGHGPRRGGPGMPPPPHAMQRDRARIPENAPEEIKNAYKEMRSLRKDLNLELRKDKPDAAKAMEMLKKSEELHMKVREWEVKQILDGNAPKPRAPRPGFGPGQKGPGAKPGFGPQGAPAPFGPRQGGCFVPPPPMMWTWGPYGTQMMPMPPHRPGFGPMPGCRCGGHGPRPDMNKPAPEAPAPEVPAPEKTEDAKL